MGARACVGLICFTLTAFLVMFGVQATDNYLNPPGATSPDKTDDNAVVIEYVSMDKKAADIREQQKYQYMLETNEISDERRGQPLKNGCVAAQYTWGCCYEFPDVDFPLCVNITYLPHDYGLNFTLEIGAAVFNEEISLRNPPPMCLDSELLIPYKLGRLCIRIHNIDVTAAHVHFCAKLLVEVLIKSIYTKELGCVDIPIKKEDLLEHQRHLLLQ